MAIINILFKTAILFACSLIQVFGVLIEGAAKLFDKLGDYLVTLHDKLAEKADDTKKGKPNINVPL